jgi:hypothetical protein
VLAEVVADAELVADRQGRDLGAKLLLGVADAAEGVGQVPVQAAGVACRVGKPVKRGRQIVGGGIDLSPWLAAEGFRTTELLHR